MFLQFNFILLCKYIKLSIYTKIINYCVANIVMDSICSKKTYPLNHGFSVGLFISLLVCIPYFIFIFLIPDGHNNYAATENRV